MEHVINTIKFDVPIGRFLLFSFVNKAGVSHTHLVCLRVRRPRIRNFRCRYFVRAGDFDPRCLVQVCVVFQVGRRVSSRALLCNSCSPCPTAVGARLSDPTSLPAAWVPVTPTSCPRRSPSKIRIFNFRSRRWGTRGGKNEIVHKVDLV